LSGIFTVVMIEFIDTSLEIKNFGGPISGRRFIISLQ